jgi:hypothetical protein
VAVAKVNPIPAKLHFYVVPYFQDEIQVFRDLIFTTFKGPVLFYFMKIKPLAFIITDAGMFANVPDWNCYFDTPIKQEVDVELFNYPDCSTDWPQNTNYYNIPILYGKTSGESIIGVPAPSLAK